MATFNSSEESFAKRTFDVDPVPDFSTKLAAWQAREDYALIADLTQRSDKAIRRSLYEGACEWMRDARQHPTAFQTFARSIGIPRANGRDNGTTDRMLVRLLFGRSLSGPRVTEYANVMRHWFLGCPEATLADAEQVKIGDIRGRPAAGSEGEMGDDTKANSGGERPPALTRDEALRKMATRPPDMEIPIPPGLTIATPLPAVTVPLDDGTLWVWFIRASPDPVHRELFKLAVAQPETEMSRPVTA